MRGGDAAIANAGPDRHDGARSGVSPCLSLLFREGERPDALAIGRALESDPRYSVSHRPGPAAEGASPEWFELLVDGLTFDILGLAPGRPSAPPPIRHRFEFAEPDERIEGIGLAAGPHLAAAQSSLAVVRAMAMMTVDLAHALEREPVGVVWLPSASAMGVPYFTDIVDSWAGGGPFPSLGLVGIVGPTDGTLTTDGLAFFSGQELIVEGRAAEDRPAATHLLAPMIDFLVGAEPVREATVMRGPDDALYDVAPSRDGRIVHVRRRGDD